MVRRRAFEELGDDAALATVWTELAMIEWMPCRFHRATLAADRAIEHARRSGDKRLLSKAVVPLIAGQMLGLATPTEAGAMGTIGAIVLWLVVGIAYAGGRERHRRDTDAERRWEPDDRG